MWARCFWCSLSKFGPYLILSILDLDGLPREEKRGGHMTACSQSSVGLRRQSGTVFVQGFNLHVLSSLENTLTKLCTDTHSHTHSLSFLSSKAQSHSPCMVWWRPSLLHHPLCWCLIHHVRFLLGLDVVRRLITTTHQDTGNRMMYASPTDQHAFPLSSWVQQPGPTKQKSQSKLPVIFKYLFEWSVPDYYGRKNVAHCATPLHSIL